MLKQRVLTALVAGALVVAGVLWLPPLFILMLAGAAALAGGWEWTRLAGLRAPQGRIAYLALLILIGAAVWMGTATGLVPAFLGVAAAWWVGVAAWLVAGGGPRTEGRRPALAWLAVGLLALPALALGLGWLAQPGGPGRGVLLYVVCLVWAADIGAYFAGRAFGRHKLAPAVSAGKTWEGLAGGLGAVLVYALAGAWLLDVPPDSRLPWLSFSIAAGGLSVAGDLFESVLKREAGVKDSGAVLPGHGGVLDRIDSLIAAVPVLALGLEGLWLTGAG